MPATPQLHLGPLLPHVLTTLPPCVVEVTAQRAAHGTIWSMKAFLGIPQASWVRLSTLFNPVKPLLHQAPPSTSSLASLLPLDSFPTQLQRGS